ncbi:carbohydrate kinase [Bacillus sp. OG2]|nr:carbohydrate kinase [Bacillus sp. OG2]
MTGASVICIGELIVDFFCTDIGMELIEGRTFEKQAGGAPANVCAAIVKLGGSAVFSGKVGEDPFGHFLKKTLDQLKVDTSMLVFDKDHPTTLAFVSLKADGERDFIFNRGADAYFTENDIQYDRLSSHNILHFGSATALLEGAFQQTYLRLMKEAGGQGKFISFDPNYRSGLWKGNRDRFIELAGIGVSLAHFVKVSDEELKIISGADNLKDGISVLHDLGANTVAVTLGKEGTMLSNGETIELIPSLPIKSVDSTGAGDAFVGAALYQFSLEEFPHQILEDWKKLREIISFSNKVGALVCTKVGAISALPDLEETKEFLL